MLNSCNILCEYFRIMLEYDKNNDSHFFSKNNFIERELSAFFK